MKYTIIFLILSVTIFFYSCEKEVVEQIPLEEINRSEDSTANTCIPILNIPLQDTSEYFKAWKGTQEYGIVTAIRDSLEWEGSIRVQAGRNNTLSIFFQTWYDYERSTQAENLYIRTNLSFDCQEVNAYKAGKENVFPEATYSIIHYDVTLNRYCLIEEENNFLELTKIDTINNEIEGKFMLSFVMEEPINALPEGPDTLRFWNGSFSCKIIE